MNSQRVELIMPGLRALWDAPGPVCVTIESPDGAPWLQAMRSPSRRGAIRLSYPLDEEPAAALRARGLWTLPELAVYDWGACPAGGWSATLSLRLPEAADPLAAWVDQAFDRLYAYGDRADFEVDVLPMGPFVQTG